MGGSSTLTTPQTLTAPVKTRFRISLDINSVKFLQFTWFGKIFLGGTVDEYLALLKTPAKGLEKLKMSTLFLIQSRIQFLNGWPSSTSSQAAELRWRPPATKESGSLKCKVPRSGTLPDEITLSQHTAAPPWTGTPVISTHRVSFLGLIAVVCSWNSVRT